MYIKKDGRVWGLDLCGLGQAPVINSCENSNEHLGSIKCREFLD
jgi:hypothetical protein